MGRVDEARRRLQAQTPAGVERMSEGGVAVDELSRDAYPAEAPADPVAVPDVMVTATPEAEPPVEAPAKTARSVFEHVTARLAQKVVVDTHMAAGSREQYRRLAATLHRTQAESGLKVVMVGSAVASEGKTLTTANLALTLSESYQRRVLLIDADFRRPSQHDVFKVPGTPGLMDSFQGPELKSLPVHQISATLSLVTAGTPTNDPMAALTSPSMAHILTEARQTFDWILIDTPPVGLLADAHLLASMVDGTLLVVRANSTPFALVKHALEVIGSGAVIGVLLNGATERSAAYGYGYGYSYHNYATVPDKTS